LEAIEHEHVRPLRRAEYDQLVALGAFQDERIELLHGSLVQMSPIGAPHSSSIQRLMVILVRALSDVATVRCQLPLAVSDYSEPEPDFAVVPLGEYDEAHPTSAHLVIEVADSSLATDRGTKLRLYADCGIPEYWIVNLVDAVIEVHRSPRDGSYASTDTYRKGQAVRPSAFPELEIRVEDVVR
jgi:Uma2 family endonuclease